MLERRFLASGGTGRSVGIVRQLYPTTETTQMVVRSLRVFQQFREVTGGDASYVACGCLIGVAPSMRATLETTVARQRALGVKAEILTPADVARVEPRIDPAGLGAVLWEPESGYGDPTAVTLGYADAARRAGVTIEQGVEVTAIERQGDRVVGVTTSAGDRVIAPAVVIASGLWSPAVARMAGVTLPIIIGRHPVFVVERDAGVRPAARRLSRPGRRGLRASRDGRAHADRLTDRRRDAAPDGPRGAGRRRGRRRGGADAGADGALGAAAGGGNVPRAAGRAPSTSHRTGCRSSIGHPSTACGWPPA